MTTSSKLFRARIFKWHQSQGTLGFVLLLFALTLILPGCEQNSSQTSTPGSSHVQTSSTMQSTSSLVFASSSFGIMFQYAPHQGGDTIATKVDGNKIYVYDVRFPYVQGEYIQVFKKDSKLTLQQAITKIILVGYNTSHCLIGPARQDSFLYPSNYQTASIQYSGTSNGWTVSNTNTCPSSYLADNSIAFFLMDTQHPDKLLFFSIGQFPIDASTDPKVHQRWQDTIRFL